MLRQGGREWAPAWWRWEGKGGQCWTDVQQKCKRSGQAQGATGPVEGLRAMHRERGIGFSECVFACDPDEQQVAV